MREGLLSDQIEARRVCQAIDAVGKVMGAKVAAILFQEPNGELYLAPHPAYGVTIVRLLASMDWQSMIRVAEEFTP